MIANIVICAAFQLSKVLVPVLFMTLLKSIVLFTIVTQLIRVFNVTSVRTKYVLWGSLLFSISLIAIYTFASPGISIPFFQISPHSIKEVTLLSKLFFPQPYTLTINSSYTVESAERLQHELRLVSESLHWSFWVLCAWIAGSLLSLLYIFTGRIGVTHLSRTASTREASYFH
jgi:hypothetical protein